MKRVLYDIISFHPGKQHNLEQAQQIHAHFKNFRHVTGLFVSEKWSKKIERWLPKFSKYINKRSASFGGAQLVDSHVSAEIKMLIKRRINKNLGYKDYLERNLAFQEWIIKKYAAPKVCIGFDTSSWKVFEAWKDKSFLVLDLSIALPQYKLVLAKENHLSKTFIQNQTAGDELIYNIYSKEIALADLILCGSQFVKDSCLAAGVPSKKLAVIPYGTDLKRFRLTKKEKQNSTIKVAFIGTVSYRKGADVLLKAWTKVVEAFPTAELHFYGNIQIEIPEYRQQVFFHGYMNQDDLIEELKEKQISVLPTFFEGSSLAVYQSMAMGMAVITTPNSGSIIENEYNGLLVSYGDEEKLATALKRLIADEPLRNKLVTNAINDVKDYTWDEYGVKLAQLIEKSLHPLVSSAEISYA